MQNQLSQKERMFLEDLKSEEELCVTKYKAYAQQAQDSQLTQLFDKLSSEEHKHYDTINQILQGNFQGGGQTSQGQQGQGGGQMSQAGQSGGQMSQAGQSGGQMSQASGGQMNMQGLQAAQFESQMGKTSGQQQSSAGNSSDKTLLHDMLSMEKFVSSAYDKSIFESAQPAIRQALQHIQKDEQGHGEQLFQYMNSHGMYQVQ